MEDDKRKRKYRKNRKDWGEGREELGGGKNTLNAK